MKKMRCLFLALAVLSASVVLVSGCKQAEQGGGAGQGSGQGSGSGSSQGGGTTPTPPTTPQQPTQESTGEAVELSATLDIGWLTLSVTEGKIAVHFREKGTDKVYTGNGIVGKGGAVEFRLHAVGNTSDSIPFKGTYTKVAPRRDAVFTLEKLTDRYPYHPIPIKDKYAGVTPEQQRTFVRYVHGLENEFEKGKNNVSAVFFVTLKDDIVMVTVVAGNETIGMRSTTKNLELTGNKVTTEMEIAGSGGYVVELTFNEDQERTTEDRTAWYLGRQNTDENIKKKGPDTVGGLRIYKKYQDAVPEQPLLEDKVLVDKTFLVKDATGSFNPLGTLHIVIRGRQVEMTFTQSTWSGLGEQVGMSQVRRVHLNTARVGRDARAHLFYSTALKSAQDTAGGVAAIMTDEKGKFGTSETVFVFRNQSLPAAATAPTYNTYDFRITEFNAADNSFYLQGEYLTGTTTAAAAPNTAGTPLVGTANGAEAQIYTGALHGRLLDGRTLVQGK